jgi:hypothetical protein
MMTASDLVVFLTLFLTTGEGGGTAYLVPVS